MRLFDFDYRLEIYTPANKRRWGYYVLPFQEAVANGLAQELQLMLEWVEGKRIVVGRRGKLCAALRSALKEQ